MAGIKPKATARIADALHPMTTKLLEQLRLIKRPVAQKLFKPFQLLCAPRPFPVKVFRLFFPPFPLLG